VTVADPAVADPFLQQEETVFQEAAVVVVDGAVVRPAHGAADVGRRLAEVLLEVPPQQAEPPVGKRGLTGRGVKLRHLAGDPAGLGEGGPPPGHEGGKEALLGEALHDHRVLDDGTGRLQGKLLSPPVYPGGPEIEVGGEPAVELHLPPAPVGPLAEGGVVEKAEIDGLLDLVDQLAGEKYGGDVGLGVLDTAGAVGIESG